MSAARPLYGDGSLHIEAYDAFYHPPPRAMAGDIAFYRALARDRQPVLDLCCGSGRVALPLAEAGIEVTGLDLASGMLALAAEKRARLPEAAARRLELQRGDLADFALERRFGLIIVAFRSFQVLLTVEAQRAALAAIRRHLLPDGRAVLHLFDPLLELLLPDRLPPEERASVVSPRSGNPIEVTIATLANDPLAQVKRTRWHHRELGAAGETLRQETAELALRWTYRWEMRHLLTLAGFTVTAEYSSFERAPPAYGGEQIWVVAPASPPAGGPP